MTTTPIKQWLKAKGHTQAWLAEQLGVKRQAVSQWSLGEYVPTPALAFQIVALSDGDLAIEDLIDPTGEAREHAGIESAQR